jgi:site-specific DNA recombinase
VTAAANKKVRCAVYTRVSTEAGLDQDFNSLDAQYDAAQAYIRSQTHAGWMLIRHRYDDGGFSGGSNDRPALQQLIADIKDHKINVVVVYKVDRLTRSLADFAKLVELFDAHAVSFVSVTQQFNTTTSMGRLTLNVLLSFAQFEREVTAERIRDKIGASKRKGLWVGGTVPLGYQLKDGKLLIVAEEAEQVRTIFRRYLKLGSVNRLVVDLRERNFRSKVRKLSDGRTSGGVPFTQGPLFYMLRNRFYVGEVRYKNAIYPGPQPPLMDRELFDAVQEKLTAQWSHRTTTRNSSPALLRGLLFDESGHPMRPTHATKNGVRYRYYVSQPYLRGITTPPPGAIVRVPAAEIESAVVSALKAHLHSAPGRRADQDFIAASVSRIEIHKNELRSAPGSAAVKNLVDRDLIASSVSRIEIHKNQLAVWLKPPPSEPSNVDCDGTFSGSAVDTNVTPLLIPWCKPPFRKARELLLPASVSRGQVRAIKAERRASLLKSIARGRQWLDEIVSGAVQDVEQIAQRHNCSVREVHMTISMAFIAPSLVQAAVEGRLPRGISVASLRDAPAEWSLQFARLGLIEPSKSVLH